MGDHALLFKNIQSVSEPALEQYAATSGLDQVQLCACMQSRKYANVVEDDVKEASRFGVTGTPTFFINGRMLEGYYPAETLEKIIDEELALKATVRK